MSKDEILVIRCTAAVKAEEINKARRIILNQMEDGVVVLPWYLEPIIVPAGLEVRIEEAEL